MDGVLADFDRDVKAMQHIDEMPWLTIPHFFRDLQPIGNPDKTISKLMSMGYEVYLLTKVENRDHSIREYDKLEWVAKYIPSLPLENLIIVPIHEDKIDYLKSPLHTSVLLDDYKMNLLLWKRHGGIAVKFGNKLKDSRPYHQIESDISQLIPLVEELEKDI